MKEKADQWRYHEKDEEDPNYKEYEEAFAQQLQREMQEMLSGMLVSLNKIADIADIMHAKAECAEQSINSLGTALRGIPLLPTIAEQQPTMMILNHRKLALYSKYTTSHRGGILLIDYYILLLHQWKRLAIANLHDAVALRSLTDELVRDTKTLHNVAQAINCLKLGEVRATSEFLELLARHGKDHAASRHPLVG